MGEVFLARDTKLDREVALKFLPFPLQQDESARLRFIREAKAAAAIDHPYICSIYDVGQTEDGQDFIAMEYVAGQTLQERLKKGPIPLDRALPILIETADAIEKAHNAGFIHRDLKPANLILTPEGHVKVMDFGLAKRILSQGATEQEVTAGLTREGSTLGTLSYMSPEQIRGEDLDARSDIFSFGVILYETLTGEHPFRRKQPMETAAAIMNEPVPPLGRFLGEVPNRLEWVISKLLSKESGRRYQLIHEVKTDLEDLKKELKTGSTHGATTVSQIDDRPTAHDRRQLLPWVAATCVLAVLLALSVWRPWGSSTMQEPNPLRRLDVRLSPGVSLSISSTGPATALSPDESTIAFIGRPDEGGESRIYLRPLDQLEAEALPGTEAAYNPTFSPDGEWIAFRAKERLQKISVKGGAPVTLCNTQRTRGIAWSDDGSIVFAVMWGGLSRIGPNGGTPELLTNLEGNETSHRWPQVLPGGEWILFTADVGGSLSNANIVVQRLGSTERKVVWRGGQFGRYLPTGHLVYLHENSMFAAPFDLETLTIDGQPVPVLDGVATVPGEAKAEFTFSNKGTLLYLPGMPSQREFTLEWLDRQDNLEPLFSEPARIGSAQFSPDGRHLALEIHDGRQWDISIFEWESQRLARLTFDEGNDENPVWSPDGSIIVFSSDRYGVHNLFWKRSDGSGESRRLTDSRYYQRPNSWHPNEPYLAFDEVANETRRDIHILRLERDGQSGWKAGETTVFANSPFVEGGANFSPDGRWLAHVSDETGIWEVYVSPFPGPGGKRQISSGGGIRALWSPDSQELFFQWGGRQFYRVKYRIEGGNFIPAAPEDWSKHPIPHSVRTLHPGGDRLVVRKPVGESDRPDLSRIVFLENFFDYLKEQAPVDE
jgi:serine/threonine-protein kinase